MTLPKPEVGLVIRYSYLWRREAQQGQDEGVKDRPCAIVAAVTQVEDGRHRVVVVPITHTPPKDPRYAIEIPPKVARSIGLDWARSWIVTNDTNNFTWPGTDIRSVKGAGFAYGKLPYSLTEKARQQVLDLSRQGMKSVERDEKDPAKLLADIKRKKQLGDIDNDQGK